MRQNPIRGHGAADPLPRAPRFGAAFIDFLILLIPEVIAYLLIAAGPINRWAVYLQSHPKQGVSGALNHNPGVNAAVYHFYIAIEVITAVYLIATYLALGATVGKMAFGLRIRRVDGQPLTPLNAALRSVPFWLPLLLTPIALPLLFFVYVGGSLLILSRPDRRGIADLLGRSMVVRQQFSGSSLQELVGTRALVAPPREPPRPASGGGGHLPGWEPDQSPPSPVPSAPPEPGGEELGDQEEGQ